MKKIFKGMAILAVTAAVGTGLALTTGCGGKDGEYIGSYHYANPWNPSQSYGIVVKVYVENNIITRVEDITKTREDSKDWIVVSEGWADKQIWIDNEEYLLAQYEGMSVAEVLAIKAYTATNGQPYGQDKNADALDNSLVISQATQGSIRLLLAVQDALGQTYEYGRVQTPSEK